MLKIFTVLLIAAAMPGFAHDGTIIVGDSHPDDGSIVIKVPAPVVPTWICPNGQSGIPPMCG